MVRNVLQDRLHVEMRHAVHLAKPDAGGCHSRSLSSHRQQRVLQCARAARSLGAVFTAEELLLIVICCDSEIVIKNNILFFELTKERSMAIRIAQWPKRRYTKYWVDELVLINF